MSHGLENEPRIDRGVPPEAARDSHQETGREVRPEVATDAEAGKQPEPPRGQQLMLAFQAGDESAFDDLVREQAASVKHFLFRYLRDQHRAEDLTQEVFIRVFRSRDRYVPSASFRTWLFTIATRLALNEIRGVRRRRRVFSEVDASADGEDRQAPWESAPDAREPSPESKVEEAELDEVLSLWIDELPENQRAAVLLSRMQEMPYKEIASTLDVSVMAVKSLLMRARETLRQRLERYRGG